MSSWLETLPTTTQESTAEENDWTNCHFIIDQVLRPDALEKLYQIDGSITARYIFGGTEYEELADIGPVWISSNGSSASGVAAATICHESLAGLAIYTPLPTESAFEHAQYLLTQHDHVYGESLCRYYDPRLWSALALSLPGLHALFGPWEKVSVPLPKSGETTSWLHWNNPIPKVLPVSCPPLASSSDTLALHREIRWHYWTMQYLHIFPVTVDSKNLPNIISNLQLLVDNGIHESRHLLRLLPHLPAEKLDTNSTAMSILKSSLSASQKIKALEK